MCVNFRPTTSSPRDGAEFSLRGELLRAACCEAERWASGAEDAGMELADPSLVDGDTASVAAGVCGVEARMGGDEDEDAFSFDIEMVVLRSSTARSLHKFFYYEYHDTRRRRRTGICTELLRSTLNTSTALQCGRASTHVHMHVHVHVVMSQRLNVPVEPVPVGHNRAHEHDD